VSSRVTACVAALASVVLVLAQDVAPTWSGFHSWQYAAALGLGASTSGAYANGARKGHDGTVGTRLAIAMMGVLVIIAAGIASGLLGADTETVAGAPGTVAPLPGIDAAAFFPAAGASAIVGGDVRVGLRRRNGSAFEIGPGERHYLGGTALELAPQIAAYVEARDRHGRRLTITRPTDPAFLSPVLLFERRVTIAGKSLPADAFATPALHRQIKAFYFAKGRAPSVLFAVDDDNGRAEPGGIGFAPSGTAIELAGLRLRSTLGTYPAIVVSAVPYPAALWVGGLLVMSGLAVALRQPPVKSSADPPILSE